MTLYSGFVTAEFDPHQASEQQVYLAMQGGQLLPTEDQPTEASL